MGQITSVITVDLDSLQLLFDKIQLSITILCQEISNCHSALEKLQLLPSTPPPKHQSTNGLLCKDFEHMMWFLNNVIWSNI